MFLTIILNVENQEVNVDRTVAILRMSFCVSCMGGTEGCRHRKALLTESGVGQRTEWRGEKDGVGRGRAEWVGQSVMDGAERGMG